MAENRERHLASAAAWREKNREKLRLEAKARRERNADAYAARNTVLQGARRWRIFNQGNTLTVLHMQLAQEFWGWRCAYCGNPTRAKNYRRGLDHVVAISQGGAHAPGNIVTCCFTCNTKKNKRPLPAVVMDRLEVQLERFVLMLPEESNYKGMGRPTYAALEACTFAAKAMRGKGVIVGVGDWTPGPP